VFIEIEKLKRQVRKVSHCGSKQQERSPDKIARLLVRPTYICALLFSHIMFVVNHTFNATPTERLQQLPILFEMNCTNRTFFLWRFHLAPPTHSGHCITLLRLESLSRKCAKFHTVAASKNRDHTSCSLYFCLFAPPIWVLLFTHIRSWWIAHWTQR